MKKKLLFLFVLIGLTAGVTALVACFAKRPVRKDGIVCVTSFLPIRILTEAVCEGANGVTVENLTENHSGCLHDYTLTTQDMKLLSAADLFLVNGGGMELFLTKVAKDYKNLKIVDTSEGYSFLEGTEHHHDHDDHEDADHDHEDADHDHEDADHDHDEHEDVLNAHIWMDIDGYLLQLERVEAAMVELDPGQERIYRKNAQNCREKLMALKKEYESAAESIQGNTTVVFHEGYVYMLGMLGVEVLHCLPMDSETQISAGEAAEIVDECRIHNTKAMFAPAGYETNVQNAFQKETGCKVAVLDSLTGELPAEGKGIDAYCNAMRKNLETVKRIYGGD